VVQKARLNQKMMNNKRMGFVMKPKSVLLNVQESSTMDTPIFKKKLDGGVEAEANRDGTIFVAANIPDNALAEAIRHEKVHLDQMAQGRLQYTDDSVIWKKDTKSPSRVYKRAAMNEGHPDFPWEKEAYKK
jgi:hypothetical protein